METMNLLYIDDGIDPALSGYLSSLSRHLSSTFGSKVNYSELPFKPDEGYESLLADKKVRAANVILIDSRLFENRTATNGKFSGEEFKVVLKKFYPFIEVIVITQNDSDTTLHIVGKYRPAFGPDSTEYYDKYLSPEIERALENVAQYRLLAGKMKENKNWEQVLKEKVLGALDGADAYDELKKTDIDALISAFQQIQKKIQEKSDG